MENLGAACRKCMHGQTMSKTKWIFCTYWVEVEHCMHSCIYYENKEDSFFQSLKPYDQNKYLRMVNTNLTETHKEIFGDSEIVKAMESHKRNLERIGNVF